MRNYLLLLAFLSFVLLAGCQKKDENKVQDANVPPGTRIVKVEDKLDAADYTYLQVSDKENNKFWIAVTRMDAAKGDLLYFTKSIEMKNFHSKTLNRDFESVLFVEDAVKTPHNMNAPQSTARIDPQTAHSQVMSTPKANLKVEHLKDGKTVEQIYNEIDKLNGKVIKIRGEVVKYNPEIMDRNWIHIQDGTGSGNTFDLMVTSKDKTQVGQIIVVEGKVATNKDFGAGYTYKVMLEDAKIKVEKGT